MPTSELPRIDPLEPRYFERRYRRARRAVVLRGFVPEAELRRWSFASLAAEFRDLTVPALGTRAGAVTPDPRRGFQARPVPLAAVLDELGGAGAPSLYMMAWRAQLPAAWRERITTPVYCADAPWIESKVWLSPAGTVTQMHRDAADNLHLQLLGAKRFTLFDKTQSGRLYPNSVFSNVPNGCRVDPEAPDFARHPRFRDAQAERAELEPGDAIYIPRGTWHHVRTLADSLSANFWFARGANLPFVVATHLLKRLRRLG